MRTGILCRCGGEMVLGNGRLTCSDCRYSLDAEYDGSKLLYPEQVGLPEMTPAEKEQWDIFFKGWREKRTGNQYKYNNRRVTYDGHTFDSLAEAVRYTELRELEESGAIWGLQLQVRYVLQEGFKDWTGRRQRAITYRPDFVYETCREQEWLMRSRLHKAVKPKPDEAEQVITVVEDVKGMRPQAYAIRSRLFMACYPCLHFHEVNSKEVWDGDHSALPVEIRLALNNSEKETA